MLPALPEPALAVRRRQAEVVVGAGGRHPPTRSAVEKPDLDQERLVDILDRLFLLADGGGDAGSEILIRVTKVTAGLEKDSRECVLLDGEVI